jgi:hypothetical protein
MVKYFAPNSQLAQVALHCDTGHRGYGRLEKLETLLDLIVVLATYLPQ